MSKPYYKVHLYMKSGNVITFYSEKIKYVMQDNGDITDLEWNSTGNRYPHLQTINPLNIEAITAEEIPSI